MSERFLIICPRFIIVDTLTRARRRSGVPACEMRFRPRAIRVGNENLYACGCGITNFLPLLLSFKMRFYGVCFIVRCLRGCC